MAINSQSVSGGILYFAKGVEFTFYLIYLWVNFLSVFLVNFYKWAYSLC